MTPTQHATLTAALGLALIVAGCLGIRAAPAEAPTPNAALEAVPLVNHVAFGVFEMDVFIERPGEPGSVYRPTPAEASDPSVRAQPLFATASMTPHDPTFLQAGPFAKGAPLGFTLGQWLDGRGAVAYRCEAGTASVDASFARLVPGGLYTIWYARLTMTAGAITGALELPLGASDGAQNTFRADPQGNGGLQLDQTPCLLPTTVDATGTGVATVFAAVYHSDGKVYGPLPGDFGSVSHAHLFGIAKALRA